MDIRLSALSREFVRVPVSATVSGVAINPTGDVVQMAVTAAGVDPTSEWVTASWETITATTGNQYLGKVEVGPGSTIGALSVGTYEIWIKVTDSPEVPVAHVGRLAIY